MDLTRAMYTVVAVAVIVAAGIKFGGTPGAVFGPIALGAAFIWSARYLPPGRRRGRPRSGR